MPYKVKLINLIRIIILDFGLANTVKNVFQCVCMNIYKMSYVLPINNKNTAVEILYLLERLQDNIGLFYMFQRRTWCR